MRVPPWASINALEMVRPIPAPPLSRLRTASPHPVAHATHGVDKPPAPGVGAELATQVADVDIDDAFITDPGGVPDLGDQVVAGQHLAGAQG